MTYKNANDARKHKRDYYREHTEEMRKRNRKYHLEHEEEIRIRNRIYRTEYLGEIKALTQGVEYERKRKYTRMPIKERFLSKVDTRGDEECWIWKSSVNKNGYGKFGVTTAHRMSYILFVGNIPDGMLVCHTCDNPPCVNPKHLFLGNNLDNIRDCVNKGRQHKQGGEDSHNHKLTWNIVLDMRTMHNNGVLKKDIAEKYNISRSHVSRITLGKSWIKK